MSQISADVRCRNEPRIARMPRIDLDGRSACILSARFPRYPWLPAFCQTSACEASLAEIAAQTQPKIVKIFGAGGLRGLEAYQSGFLISGEGHILTAWSYVLDSDVVTVYLDDGRKLAAEVLGMDPRSEIAVLKIDGQDLPHFKLEEAVTLTQRRESAGVQQHVRRRPGQRTGQRAARRCRRQDRSRRPAAERLRRTIAARPTCSMP